MVNVSVVRRVLTPLSVPMLSYCKVDTARLQRTLFLQSFPI